MSGAWTQTETKRSDGQTHRSTGAEKRQDSRVQKDRFAQAKVSYQSRPGVSEQVQVRLCDVSANGCGVVGPVKLDPGSVVSIAGPLRSDAASRDCRLRARLIWSAPNPGGGFRCGLSFDEEFEGAGRFYSQPPTQANEETDFYEILQVNHKADQDTIHRVFRILAQRFHPDNHETGSPESFRKVYEAYQVLSDAERRASYDARYRHIQEHRWKIFDQPQAATGVEAERRKRQGILALLYVKRMGAPESPGIPLTELEDLLGVPREHLEFSLWYLRENGFVSRTDNGRTVITAKGVDEAERLEESSGPKLFLQAARAEPEAN